MRHALLIFALLLAGLAHAAPTPDPRRSENPLERGEAADKKPTGQLTRAPELLEFVEAAYPPEAEAAHLTGAVGLLVDIDATGAVTAVEVTEPAGHGFDEAAVAAIRKFRFSPAEIDGAPAAVRIAYRYSFVLKPQQPADAAPETRVNYRGVVVQRGDRTPVAGASVGVDDGAFGATTDAKGHFEIAGVPAGAHRVAVMAPGYDRFETEEAIVEGQATEVTYYIRKRIYSPYETVVRGKRERKEVARVELKQEEIRLIPGTQGDAFKVVQNLPGVARAPYGFGLLVVRGGRPFDTRVYVDDVWIPTIFHFGGLISVFNSDLLSDLTFQPGNFDSHLGRATAGSVEAQSRTSSQNGYHGYANVNLLDTSALLEGPIDENWSFAAAGRVSYVDLVLKQVLPSTVSFLSAPRYYDFQTKVAYAPQGGRDQVRFMAFGSNDSLKILLNNPALVDPEGRSNIGMSVGFNRLLGSWTHNFSPSTRHKLTAAIGNDTATSNVGSDIRSDGVVTALQLRNALTWDVSDAVSLEFGTDSYIGRYWSDVVSPPMPLPGEIPDPIASRQLLHTRWRGTFLEPAVFAQATLKPWEGTRIVPGLRLDYEHTLDYVSFDPRINFFQQLSEKTLFKAGVGLYQQPPDFRMGQWTPEFGNPALGAERSLQTMVGVERKLGDSTTLDFQLYYKRLSHQVRSSTRTLERDGKEELERYANSGIGRDYGAEVLLRHDLTQNFFGWISYSLSRAEVQNPYSSDPSWHRFQFDQPHHLVVVASYKWPYDWVTGLRFQYASGNLYTPYIGSIYDSDGDYVTPLPGRGNSARNPAFVSLDLRLDKRFVFQTWMINVFLDVQNVTNNVNPEGRIYNYDFTRSKYLRGIPIFPTIGFKAEF